MSQFVLTCFADEISPDLNEQLDLLEQEGIRHIEIRNVWGKNILQLNSEELIKLGGILKDRGFAVSSIASPIGKYPVTSPRRASQDCSCLPARVKARLRSCS